MQKLTLPVFRLVAALLVTASVASAQQIAFTFDDLPAHGNLPPGVTRLQVIQSILDTLKQEHLPPVYGFVNGIHSVDEPETTTQVLTTWRKAGQPLGNHTWSHPNLDTISAEAFEADIQKNEPLLQQYMPDANWHYLRFPYLHEGDTLDKHRAVRAWLSQHGYQDASVSMDFEDYLWNDPYARCSAAHDTTSIEWLRKSYLETADQYIQVFRDSSKLLYGHDIPYILLLHVGAFDAQMLPRLIDLFRQRGFTFIPLQQALSDPAYQHDPDIGYPGGGTLQEYEIAGRHLKFPPNHKPYKELAALCPATPAASK